MSRSLRAQMEGKKSLTFIIIILHTTLVWDGDLLSDFYGKVVQWQL